MKSFVFNQCSGQRMFALGLLATFSLAASVSVAADVHIGLNIAAGQQVPLSAIDHSPWDATSSIRNHTAKLFGYNIWKNLKLIVGGQPRERGCV